MLALDKLKPRPDQDIAVPLFQLRVALVEHSQQVSHPGAFEQLERLLTRANDFSQLRKELNSDLHWFR